MREVKYRAWDKKSKKFRDIDSIAFHGHGAFDTPTQNIKVVNLWGRDIIENKDIIVHREAKDVDLLEYVGAKDMNGNEIYDGYIVKDYDDVFHWVVVYDEDSAKYMMQGISINDRLMFDEFIGLDNKMHVDVIGNIYDNPELIR